MTDQTQGQDNDNGAGKGGGVVSGAAAGNAMDDRGGDGAPRNPDLPSLLLAIVEKLGWRNDPAFAEFIEWADHQRNPDRLNDKSK